MVGIGDGCRRSRQVVQRCRDSVLTKKGGAKGAAGICGGWTGKFGDGITRGRAAAWLGWEADNTGNTATDWSQRLPRAGQGARCKVPGCPQPASRPGSDGVAQLQPWFGLAGWAPTTSNEQQATSDQRPALNWNLRGQCIRAAGHPFVYLCQPPALTVQ